MHSYMHKTFLLAFTVSFIQIYTITIHAQGKVGINTTIPAAMLHVQDSSVLFSASVPLPDMPGAPPISGPGARLMWYPAKGAFRVGVAYGPEWDKDSIGVASFATGVETKAKGRYSTAMGSATLASGIQSLALGASTTASGSVSTSMGAFTLASGAQSTATGLFTEASGYYSFSSGYNTIASGQTSFTSGDHTIASGWRSSASGYLSKASGQLSTAAGESTLATDYGAYTVGLFNDTVNDAAVYRLFAVGNGNSGIRKNALTILLNG